jgi:hypothetical protein
MRTLSWLVKIRPSPRKSRSVRHWLVGAALATAAILSLTAAQTAVASGCSPIPVGDYVHESSGDASGHGWWLQNNCPYTQASVYVDIWEYWISDSTWHDMGSGYGFVYPGGGSGNRATARAHCNTSEYRNWKSEVFVQDTATGGGSGGPIWTNPQSIPCRD